MFTIETQRKMYRLEWPREGGLGSASSSWACLLRPRRAGPGWGFWSEVKKGGRKGRNGAICSVEDQQGRLRDK